MKFYDNQGLVHESHIEAAMVSIGNKMRTSVFSKVKLPKFNKKSNHVFEENNTFPIGEVDSFNYNNEHHKINYDEGSNILILSDKSGTNIDYTTPITGDIGKSNLDIWNNIESSISSDV